MLQFFPRKFALQSIGLYIFISIIVTVSFPSWFLGFQWFLFGLVSVLFFFLSANKLSLKWINISVLSFQKKLFWFAFSVRLLYVIFSYFYYKTMTGGPFEYDGWDAKGYHNEALWMVDLFKTGHFEDYFVKYITGWSDRGYPLFLFPFNLIFGETIIIPRFVDAFLGAWMAILVYRLARRNFGESSGRISAILTAVLPNLIYYTGLHMKETLMTFLLVAFFERADLLLRTRVINIKLILIVLTLGISLFLFRTVLAVAGFISLFIAFIYTKKQILGSSRRLAYLLLFTIAGFIIINIGFKSEVEKYYGDRSQNQKDQMEMYSTYEGGNKLAKYGSAALFAPVILFAPFPTLVNTNQLNTQMLNGAMFTRNIYAFFILLSVIILWRQKLLRNHVLLLSIIASYLLILSVSGFAFSERFHLPMLPFLLILAGYGITNWKGIYKKYFDLYLLFMMVIIFAWNWFKITGRT